MGQQSASGSSSGASSTQWSHVEQMSESEQSIMRVSSDGSASQADTETWEVPSVAHITEGTADDKADLVASHEDVQLAPQYTGSDEHSGSDHSEALHVELSTPDASSDNGAMVEREQKSDSDSIVDTVEAENTPISHEDHDDSDGSGELIDTPHAEELRDPDEFTVEELAPPSPVRTAAPEWIKYQTEGGQEYYYNARTQQSQWTRPSGLLSPTSASQDNNSPLSSHDTAMESQELFTALSQVDHTDKLESILHQGIDVNAVCGSGLMPLHVAVQYGNAHGAAILLEHGAFVDALPGAQAGNVETPLMMACRLNHASLVRLFIRYGASVFVRDLDSNTIVHVSVRCWSDEVLQALLEMDSVAAIINTRNAEDETPLHVAARHGNAAAVQALLACGASGDAEDARGRTPLVVSIMENRVDCAQLLQGVDLVARDLTNSYHQTEPAPVAETSPNTIDPQYLQQVENMSLEELHGSLLQRLQFISDPTFVSFLYHYVGTVQQNMSALSSAIQDAQRKEEALSSQVDSLTASHVALSAELEEAQVESDQLAYQLQHKDLEHTALQNAFESLSSRSAMLESIARASQDKLKRERAEHARYEEFWTQTIDNSLRENAAALQSLQSLQTEWQQMQPPPSTDQVIHHEGGQGEVRDSKLFSAQSYVESGHNTDIDPTVLRSAQDDVHYQYDYTSAPTVPVVSEAPISPSRVDAVWNRFFENVSRQNTRSAELSGETNLPPASALFDAVRKNKVDRLHELLLSGISSNVEDVGEKGTPLHLACELGDLEAVMLLYEFGADLEIRDENGNTPLLVACSQGHYECTKFLLQSAANLAAVNSNRDSALHLAVWDGSFECVSILLEYGVDPLAQNALGLTALANLKTRSPLRHRFDDLAPAHPMKKTLVLLEEAEDDTEHDDEGEPTQAAATKSSSTANGNSAAHRERSGSVSWGRWLIGSVFGSRGNATPDPSKPAGDDEGSDASFSEEEVEEGSPVKVKSASLSDYQQLRPPPEVEAVIRRSSGTSETSRTLPPPPPEILDALEKHKQGLLSPTSAVSIIRKASPAADTKKTSSSAHVRSRYVDTFNTP
ncbi:hypothetical protein Poli38472_003041 [Pythium oligandrum]|uniref:WW domain-containing protein n=1 Tax=Pythium oligandrum TaxID=41045 RepID=A0A8K1C634_PYTOL|nr:hypothetical protein Poli38472_003041 [Pythium oligandrum]|eukprot:TMW57116.1 hypothetical protein Poli38472_003041 [Pythium oligandrum]